jgi:hypothetical protein
MIQTIKKLLFSRKLEKEIQLVERNFKHNYFLSDIDKELFYKNGYFILKKSIDQDAILHLSNIYTQLTTFPEYTIADRFQNSGRFQSPEIRNFVMNNISQFSKEFLPIIFNKEVYDENTTGAFQIKPPSKVSDLNPHQDAPVIDETKENALFVWIPLCDITEKNGAICVLPGSHLWGNHQRSLNVPWVFEKHTKILWKYMQPIYLKKGDILIWDSALIHSSKPNLSNQTRVAITTTLLPKNFKMVEYFKDKITPKGKVEKYEVEKSFWEQQDIMKRPPIPPNKFICFEEEVYLNNISQEHLLKLIDKYKP